MKNTAFARDQQKLLDEADGMKFIKLKEKFIKSYCKTDRRQVAETLMRWVREGKHPHLRSDVLLDILDCIGHTGLENSDFFSWSIADPALAYWSIDGLLKTNGNCAYPQIVSVARNSDFSVETRAKAVKSLSEASKQPFDQGLPSDPGEWQLKDLPLEAIEKWERSGFSDGAGHKAPATHASLNSPTTEFERIVARLDKKLGRQRAKEQDPANPSNWLVVANPKDVNEIQARWPLPKIYLDFLKNYSPLRVVIEDKAFANGLSLYGANELIQGQDGYSYNPATKNPLPDWPKHLVVIAHDGGDPFCIDCSSHRDGDAPVLAGEHGRGPWRFLPHSETFTAFLKSLAK